jgi:hypothetical protein
MPCNKLRQNGPAYFAKASMMVKQVSVSVTSLFVKALDSQS